jgi:hypothetical protein
MKMTTEIETLHAAAMHEIAMAETPQELLTNVLEFASWMAENFPEAVTPQAATLSAAVLARIIPVADGLDEPAELYQDAFSAVPVEALAAFMLPAFPWGKPDGTPNKRLALAMSESFGPDWGQTVYKLGVLITKLA